MSYRGSGGTLPVSENAAILPEKPGIFESGMCAGTMDAGALVQLGGTCLPVNGGV